MEKPANTYNELQIYSPSAIINIFQNLLITTQEKRLIALKGVYKKTGTKSYAGHWYDKLEDESTDSSLTLKIPELIRNELENNKTIDIICFITRKVKKNGTIELEVNVTNLLTQTQNKYTEEEIKSIEIIQKKANIGFKDVDSFIKKAIFENKILKISVIIGNTAKIEQDIKTQMSDAIALYEIRFVRTSITSELELKNTCYSLQDSDIIVIARGGGEGLEVFDKVDLAEYFLNLKPYLVTAIGHKNDTPLVQKIADKSFQTPTAFGQYLKDIFNDTVEEFEKSKAKITEDLKKQFDANYGKRNRDLKKLYEEEKKLNNKNLKSLKELNEKALNKQKELNNKATEDLNKVYAKDLKIKTDQLAELKKQTEFNQKEKEKNQKEKEENSKKQLEIFAKEKEEKNKILNEKTALLSQYEKNISSLRHELENSKSSSKNTILIIIVIIVTLIIVTVLVSS